MSKQFMIIIQEEDIGFLKKVIPSLNFIEVLGMDIGENNANRFLVTPRVEEPKIPESKIKDIGTPCELELA